MSAPVLTNRVLFGEEAPSWADLAAETEARIGPASDHAGARRVFVVGSMRAAMGAVAMGVAGGLDFGVIEASRLSPEVVARFSESGVTLINAGTGAPHAAQADVADTPVEPGRITVLTSGTTGLLKLIPHTARTLNTFDRVRDLAPNAWFLPYQIGSYAWYQMVALGLFVPDQTLVPGDFDDLADSFATALARGQVTAISSTPTFWRHMLMSVDADTLRAAPLRSVSMGGEIVDQAILDRLRGLYPQASLRHIYASSEAGAAIVVTDGQAGFPATLTDRADARVGVRVDGDRLFIRSPYANRGEAAEWIDTGDLVERRDGRFHFLGRAGNTMINVGGQKAFPPDIEAHLLAHPRVVWARVTARRAPLMGHLPVAEIVLDAPMEAEEAERMLTAHCEAALADYAVPRMWDMLDAIPMRGSLKS